MLVSGRPVAGVEGIAMAKSVLSVPVNRNERALLETASRQAGTSVSEFVRRRAIEAAEIDVLERRLVTIPAKDWEAFEAWAHHRPQKIAGLERLARTAPNCTSSAAAASYSR
jgi:uncharacterized protein (DUF1778 family)